MAYVLIVEHKMEEPLVVEQFLSSSSHEKVMKRAAMLLSDPKIIRICVAKLVYESGNKTLLPEESEF